MTPDLSASISRSLAVLALVLSPAVVSPRATWAEPPATAPSEEAPALADPVPAPEGAATETQPATPVAKATPRSKRDYSIPYYQQKRPRWALEIAAAGRSALGDSSTVSTADTSSIRGLQFQYEYQPEWSQALGVLGAGISAGLYTTSPANTVTNTLAGLLAYGYQIRYQARFIRNQWIVPTVGFSGEWLRYSLKGSVSGTVDSNGVFYGGMLLLSAFDEGAASELYASTGISRVYLLAEARSREGSDGNITLEGRSYFFGLRFEF